MLLSGTGDFIAMEDFRRVVKFEDHRTAEVQQAHPDKLVPFQELFWAALETMTGVELCKLASFATDSLCGHP